jgi:hypothetical protein
MHARAHGQRLTSVWIFLLTNKNIHFYHVYNFVNMKNTRLSLHVVLSQLVCGLCHLLVYWTVKRGEIHWVIVCNAIWGNIYQVVEVLGPSTQQCSRLILITSHHSNQRHPDTLQQEITNIIL